MDVKKRFEKMSSYLPMISFRATVRASTEDNRHHCASTTWGVRRNANKYFCQGSSHYSAALTVLKHV